MSLMTSLSVGVTGLKAAQTGVNTTAHNLSNVNTEGYSRQEVLFVDRTYNSIGTTHISDKLVGLGSEVEVIKQNRNVFYDKAYRLEVGRKDFYKVQNEAVTEVTELMGEMEGVQFQNTLNDLWVSVQELVKEPDSIVKRTSLINTSNTFLKRAQDVQDQLEKYQLNLNKQVIDTVDEINVIANKILDLNNRIAKAESGHEKANDYRDQRNLLLDKLASYGHISYTEDVDGRVSVSLEGSQLVTQDYVYELKTKPGEKDQRFVDVVWGEDYPAFNLEQGFSSAKDTDIGKLKALLYARGDAVANYTDIPDASDNKYKDATGNFDSILYAKDVEEYNRTVGSSVLMNTQAEFDRLVHGIVTAINDALNPNEKAETVLKDLGYTVPADVEVEYTNDLGETVKVKLADVEIWDEYHAAVGMDEAQTPREELFKRQGVDRYTEATVKVKDANGNDVDKVIWIYNQEVIHPEEKDENMAKYTLYTLKQLEINENIEDDPSKLPISGNNYLGGAEGYDVETCNRLAEIWNTEFSTVNPNVVTKYTFTDYYQAMIGELATKGNEYDGMEKDQDSLVNSLDNNRQMVSGVSSDEQLTYLIQFQYAYTASARYITTVDQMLEHLLNSLG